MRLSDVLGALDMPWYPIIGLVMFLSVFIAACVRVMRESRGEIARCAGLPLDADDTRQEDSVRSGVDPARVSDAGSWERSGEGGEA